MKILLSLFLFASLCANDISWDEPLTIATDVPRNLNVKSVAKDNGTFVLAYGKKNKLIVRDGDIVREMNFKQPVHVHALNRTEVVFSLLGKKEDLFRLQIGRAKPEHIATLTSPASHVATTENMTVYESNQTIYAIVKTKTGWDSPHILASKAHNPVLLPCKEGNAIVVWESKGKLSSLRYVNGIWQEREYIDDGRLPQVACDEYHRAFLCYIHKKDVRAKRFNEDRWEAAKDLALQQGKISQFRLHSNQNGVLALSWKAHKEGIDIFRVCPYQFGSWHVAKSPFTMRDQVSSIDCITLPHGDAIAVWQCGRTPKEKICAALMDATHWGRMFTLSSDCLEIGDISISSSENGILITWTALTPRGRILLARYGHYIG